MVPGIDNVKNVVLDVGTRGSNELRQLSRNLSNVASSLGEVSAAGETTDAELGSVNRELREMAASTQAANAGLTSLQSQMLATDALAERLDDSLDDLGEKKSFEGTLELERTGETGTFEDIPIFSGDLEVSDSDIADLNKLFSGIDDKEVDATAMQLARITQEFDNIEQAAKLGIRQGDAKGFFGDVDDLPTRELGRFFKQFQEAETASEAIEKFNRATKRQGELLMDVMDVTEDITGAGVPQQLGHIGELLTGDRFVETPFSGGDEFKPDIPLTELFDDDRLAQFQSAGIHTVGDLQDAVDLPTTGARPGRQRERGDRPKDRDISIPDALEEQILTKHIDDLLKPGVTTVPGSPGSPFQGPSGRFISATDAVRDEFIDAADQIQDRLTELDPGEDLETFEEFLEFDVRDFRGVDTDDLIREVLAEATGAIEDQEFETENLRKAIRENVEHAFRVGLGDEVGQPDILSRGQQLEAVDDDLDQEELVNRVREFRKVQEAAQQIDDPLIAGDYRKQTVSEAKGANLGEFLAAVLETFDDPENINAKRVRKRAEDIVLARRETDRDVVLPRDDDDRFLGRDAASFQIDQEKTQTRVDALEQLFETMEEMNVDNNVIRTLAKGPPDDFGQDFFELSKQADGPGRAGDFLFGGGTGTTRPGGLLNALGVKAPGSRGNVESVTEALTGFAQLLEDSPQLFRAFQVLPDSADIFDLVNEIGGEGAKAVMEFAEEYEDVLDEAFDGDILEVLIDASDAMVQDMSDLRNAIEKFSTNLSRTEAHELADILGRETDILGDGSEGPIPREIVQGQLLRQAAETDSRKRREVLQRLFNLVGRGQLGVTTSLMGMDAFLGGDSRDDNLGFVEAIESTLEGTDLAGLQIGRGRDGPTLSQAIGQQLQEDFKQSKFTTFGEFIDQFNIGQTLDKVAAGAEGDLDLTEIEEPLDQALQSAVFAQIFAEDEELASILMRTSDAFDIDDMHTGDIDNERIKMMRRISQARTTAIPSQADTPEIFESLAENFSRFMGGLGDFNTKKPLMDVEQGLFRLATTSSRTASALSFLGFSIGETADDTSDFVVSLGKAHETFFDMMPTLGIASANFGSFNISVEHGVALLKQMIALGGGIGTLITLVGGLAAGLAGATVALGSFLAVGAIGVLDQMEESMAGVTGKGEAMEEMFSALKDALSDAVDPLRRTEIGGDGLNAFQAFNAAIERTLDIVNRLSKSLSEFIETDEFANFLDILDNRLPGVGPDGAFGEAFVKFAESGALERTAKVFAGIMQAIAGFVSFSAEIIDILEGPDFLPGFFKSVGGIIQIFKILTRITARVIALVSTVTGVVFGLLDLITKGIKDVLPWGDMLLSIFKNLAELMGSSIGLVLAYSAAIYVLAGAWTALTAVSSTQLAIAIALVGVWKTLKFLMENTEEIASALANAVQTVTEFVGSLVAQVDRAIESFQKLLQLFRSTIGLPGKALGVAVNGFGGPGGPGGSLGGGGPPGLDTGGFVTSSGLATIHKGERVVPEAQVTDRGRVEAETPQVPGTSRRAARTQTVVIENNGIIGMRDIKRKIERLIEQKERDDSRRASDRFIS